MNRVNYLHTSVVRWLLFSILVAMAVFAGCSEKVVNQTADGGNVELVAKVAMPELMQYVSVLKLTVTADDMDPIVRYFELGGTSPQLALKADVPAGAKRLFVLEAFSNIVGNVEIEPTPIYRGQTVANVGPDRLTPISIPMVPLVPLIKLTPHETSIRSGQPFKVSLEAFNLPDDIRAMRVVIDYVAGNSEAFVWPDTLYRGRTLGATDSLEGHDIGDYMGYQITVGDTDSTGTIVDRNGYAHLATLTFTSRFLAGTDTTGILDSTVSLDIINPYIVDTAGNLLKTGGIYFHSALVHLKGVEDSVVTFPDPGLTAVIRNALGISSPTQPIMLSQVLGLSYLNASEYQIADLTGLDQLANLKTVYFGYTGVNSLANLRILGRMSGLTWLSLESNEITDITPLNSLRNLNYLDLSYNPITDLSPLTHLTSLYSLYLNYCSITNIAPLVNNTGLGEGDHLWLVGNALDSMSLNVYIPALVERGVSVDIVATGGPQVR
jgi:hypothetical protein